MGRPRGTNKYKAQDFIDAIPGSGGIITSIAKRVGCDWHTAKKYIEEYATVKRAYNDECETPKDWAESVIVRNIALALEKQRQTNEPVESADAKWYLKHKAKDRGYTERTEIAGVEDEPLVIQYTGNVDPEDV
jgi:uridine kinase